MSLKDDAGRLGWVANMLELPRDLVLDLPRLTIIGQKELYLENHKGIIEYALERVRIKLVRGYLDIEGEEMELKFITQDELRLCGNIRSLHYVD